MGGGRGLEPCLERYRLAGTCLGWRRGGGVGMGERGEEAGGRGPSKHANGISCGC